MSTKDIDEAKIEELLTRGVGEFIDPTGSFRKKLKESPEKIVIKFGIDPTRPDIHLGHAVILRKLKQFQDLGCKVVFLVGDFTAQIGDPTGKDKIRPDLNYEEVSKNVGSFREQVGKILGKDEKVFSWMMNSSWFYTVADIVLPVDAKADFVVEKAGEKVNITFSADTSIAKTVFFEKENIQSRDLGRDRIFTITLRGLIWTLKHITFSQLKERDMFEKRIEKGGHLFMNEMLYPVLQGIDSYAISQIYGSCDLEVGGTDQTFNMMMGREVMRINSTSKNYVDEQAVLSFKILEGLDGKEKMSKSLDNYVAITDEPFDMYGKIMSVPDASIINYYELCTFTPMERVLEIRKEIENGTVNPKDLKMDLARQIIAIYHGEKKATEAQQDWIQKFEKNEIPTDAEEIVGTGLLMPILLGKGIVESNSEARRLFEGGAITDMTENKKMTVKEKVQSGHVYKIGKHRFIKIK